MRYQAFHSGLALSNKHTTKGRRWSTLCKPGELPTFHRFWPTMAGSTQWWWYLPLSRVLMTSTFPLQINASERDWCGHFLVLPQPSLLGSSLRYYKGWGSWEACHPGWVAVRTLWLPDGTWETSRDHGSFGAELLRGIWAQDAKQ